LEKNIKDQLKSSEVIVARSSFEVFQEEGKIFANSNRFLKRSKRKMFLLYLKTSRGDGT
jgi:hypothetical protein